MSSDIDMLAILGDRKMNDRFYDHVRGNFLTKEGEDIGKELHEYFEQDVLKSETEVDWNKFAAWYFLKNPMLSHEKKDNFKALFNRLDEYEAGDSIFTQKILGELTTKHFATEIGKRAMGIADGSDEGDIQDLRHLAETAEDEILELGTGEDPYLVSNDEDFLYAPEEDNPILTFSLKGLRTACAGIQKGDFVVVGAHPDTGKTTFLLGEVAHMLPQIPEDHYILYFNNEQKGKALAHRLRAAVLKRTVTDCRANPVAAVADYKAAGGERVMLFDKSYMDTRFVEERLKRVEGKVGLIVFDQLWKIKGASNSKSDFMQMAHVYSWARDICKQNAPTIAVHQADAMGYNKKYMSMDHLFGSNVPIQGEADLIFMIGRMTDGSQRDDVRHGNVPKNKLDPGTDPLDRNPKFDMFIDHNLVRYRDV